MKTLPARIRFYLALLLIITAAAGCNLPSLETTHGPAGATAQHSGTLNTAAPTRQATQAPLAETINSPTPNSSRPDLTPTPDGLHRPPDPRTEPSEYIVQSGDTLLGIARGHWIGLRTLAEANDIQNTNIIYPGQKLIIPAPPFTPAGPGFKILPDSEVVYGPSTIGFDVDRFVSEAGGFLSTYVEGLENTTRTGAYVIQWVSQDYSINPRLLLALLEYRSGWVTSKTVTEKQKLYPLGFETPGYEGLYAQLAWACNEINRGYYLWRVNGVPNWVLKDESLVPPDAGINAGTAGIQHLLAYLLGYVEWLGAVSDTGVYAVYEKLFGYPFAAAYEPITPPDLAQPVMILPFEKGAVWRFTGAPHGAFGSGAAWAALDFAPPGESLGCVDSDAWVTALAGGLVVRAERGQVLLDLDGDGSQQTGWVVQYLHIEGRDMVKPGTVLETGDRIGHPSCEGGYSTGTHVHIARRYNGEWISADGALPFNLDGWISVGTGIAYNGYLTKNGQTVSAYVGNSPYHKIQR